MKSFDSDPPWLVFPDIPWGSIGWRMGDGEEYWTVWMEGFCRLAEPARDAYKLRWPEPDEDWTGFYGFVETKVLPHYQG